jgi:hypothetical protein
LHQFLSEPLSESPSTLHTKDKILSIDLEASSFDGITNYSRGSELVSTIAKLECLILSFFIAMCSALISTTNNAAGNLDISEIEPKFFSNLARRRSTCKRSLESHECTIFLHFINSSHFFNGFTDSEVSIPPPGHSVM